MAEKADTKMIAQSENEDEQIEQMLIRHREKFARFYMYRKAKLSGRDFISCIIILALTLTVFSHLHPYLVSITTS